MKGSSVYNFNLNWAIGVRNENGCYYKATVNDLIHDSPDKILKCRTIGQKS